MLPQNARLLVAGVKGSFQWLHNVGYHREDLLSSHLEKVFTPLRGNPPPSAA